MALAGEASREGSNVILSNRLTKILISVFAMAAVSSQAQDLVYRTCPMVSEVKTIQTIADGDFMRQPVIGTGDDSMVEISFDYLSDTQPWLTLSLKHI